VTKSLRRVARSTVVVVGAVFALAIVIMALFAGVLAPPRPDEQNPDLIEAKPGTQALFGTDRFGRLRLELLTESRGFAGGVAP